jgi:acetylornithine deacetylase/succinyl-diaminopimelate desuccinylase-like protein
MVTRMDHKPTSVVELLQALVRIPSVNPHGDPGTPYTGEQACAEYLRDVLTAIGASAELEPVLPGRPNVVGFFPSDRPGKPRLVFAPHTDTVSVCGMTIPPFGGELRDGRVWGRGSSDTKGPMAAMLWALKECARFIPSLPWEIGFVGLASEEAGQHGVNAFVKAHKVDFAIAGEPTRLGVVYAHKGALWLNIVTRGKAVHAAQPERGVNAIYQMSDIIAALRSDMIPLITSFPPHPTLGVPTLSVGTIKGGTKANIVPDLCQMDVDIRTVPGNPDLLPLLEGLIERVAPGAEVRHTRSHAMETNPEHPVIGHLLGAGGHLVGAPWFSDASVLSQHGTPAVALGPGSIDQAHTPDEWIRVSDLEEGVAYFCRFLRRLGSAPAPVPLPV